MPLTRDQLIQNIHALEQQGASQEEIQGYINSAGSVGAGAGAGVPGMEKLGGQAPPIASAPNNILQPRDAAQSFQRNHPVLDTMYRESANFVPFPEGMSPEGSAIDPLVGAIGNTVKRGVEKTIPHVLDAANQFAIGARGALKGGARAAVKSATDPTAIIGEAGAEGLAEAMGAPKGTGAAIAATPRVIKGAVQGAREELNPGTAEIPTATEEEAAPFKPVRPSRDPYLGRSRGVRGGGAGGPGRTGGVVGSGPPPLEPEEEVAEGADEGTPAGTTPSPIPVPGAPGAGGVSGSTASGMGQFVRSIYAKNPRYTSGMNKLIQQADTKDTHIGQTLLDHGFTPEHAANPAVLTDEQLNGLATGLGHKPYTGEGLSRTPAEGRASLVNKMQELQNTPLNDNPEEPEQ